MAPQEHYIGQLAARIGMTRKALRVYEAAGILVPVRRTSAGYRIYDDDAVALLAFVRRARGLGFTLAEINEIVAIKRTGRAPCRHVRNLVHSKLAELNRLREGLHELLKGGGRVPKARAAVCPHIERVARANGRPRK